MSRRVIIPKSSWQAIASHDWRASLHQRYRVFCRPAPEESPCLWWIPFTGRSSSCWQWSSWNLPCACASRGAGLAVCGCESARLHARDQRRSRISCSSSGFWMTPSARARVRLLTHKVHSTLRVRSWSESMAGGWARLCWQKWPNLGNFQNV